MRYFFRLFLRLSAAVLAIVATAPAGGAGPITPIYDIQGEGHVSPEAGNSVVTQGVITAIGFRALGRTVGYHVEAVPG